MPNRTEARPAKAALTTATGRLPLLRLFSTPLTMLSEHSFSTRPVRQTRPSIRCQFQSPLYCGPNWVRSTSSSLPVMNSFLRFFRTGTGGRGGFAQGVSAVGTINIIHSDGPQTLRTNRGELVAALRAEGEFGVDDMAASGAGRLQCLPQHKVENDAECVGNNYGHNSPKDRAHAAPFGVAVYIPDEQ